MSRVLLVLPTGTYRADAFLAAAARLGVEVTTASERAQALASVMGDRFLEVPLDDPDEVAARIARFAADTPLDAVVAVDDGGLLGAALAAERLGLAHNPPAAVAATRDKAAMRAAWARAGIVQPAFEVCEAGGEAAGDLAERAAEAGRRLGFPVVVKPTGLSGSRGVIRADDEAATRSAAERVAGILRGLGEPERLLVEAYVPGDEVAFEGLLEQGGLVRLALFDKPDPLVGPYFEETIYRTPSCHPEPVQEAVTAAVAQAVRALGLVDGPVHAELRLRPASTSASASASGLGAAPEPVMVELACRTIGGRCSAALRTATGASLEELVLRHALGREVVTTPEAGASGVMMLPVPSSGRLRAVEGLERAAKVDGVTGVEITIPVGGKVVALPEGDRYLGFLFARGAVPADVDAALRRAHAELDVRIEPEATS